MEISPLCVDWSKMFARYSIRLSPANRKSADPPQAISNSNLPAGGAPVSGNRHGTGREYGAPASFCVPGEAGLFASIAGGSQTLKAISAHKLSQFFYILYWEWRK